MEYLGLPFVLRDGYLARASLQESINYSIGLILSTRVGTLHFEPDYGCQIWEKEFSDLYMANKANIRANLRNAIDKFEKRLYNVSVDFSPSETTQSPTLGMRVRVAGNYRDENEQEVKFESSFMLG